MAKSSTLRLSRGMSRIWRSVIVSAATPDSVLTDVVSPCTTTTVFTSPVSSFTFTVETTAVSTFTPLLIDFLNPFTSTLTS